jgi:uncharacterized phage protein (TIGR01671 family)
MKREIKFRGKDKKTGEWLYGNLQVPTIEGVPYLMWDKEKFQCEVETNTIGQYTGLKDINGKEIYEGDIIKGLDSTKNDILHVVKWDNQTASFEGYLIPFDKYLHKSPLSQNWLDFFDKEVIGNIYDNPELLEK